MGVPGLFSYLARKYPKIVEPVREPTEDEQSEVEHHNLYIGEHDNRLFKHRSKGVQITSLNTFKL